MKKKPPKTVAAYRIRMGPMRSDESYGNNGQFLMPYPDGSSDLLLVQISDGGGWDHASVTVRTVDGNTAGRCPTWEEMCYVKEVFFRPDECVVQYHPPKSVNINAHDHCLHLWRPQNEHVVMPPTYMV